MNPKPETRNPKLETLNPITSLQNPKIKNLVKLRQRRYRDRQRLLLIDGARALRLALKNGFPVQTIYFTADTANTHALLLALARKRDVFLQPVSDVVFQKIGYGDNPDGVLGVAPQPAFALDALSCPPNALFLVAEGLEKPGNLGAILRSADAAGVSGVILCDTQTDVCNPNTIRASRGAFFSVPIANASTTDTLQWLHANHIQIVAASPAAAQFYFDVDLHGATAIAVGAEHSGLTDRWFEEIIVRIPMVGQVDSLNVAQSASILLFEAVRQRETPEYE